MRELKILAILIILIITFFSGFYVMSKAKNFVNNRRVEKAIVQLRVGMPIAEAESLFKGCKIHKETLGRSRVRSEKDARESFMLLLGEVRNKNPQDLFNKIKFNETSKVVWIPYNIRTEWFVGYFADIVIIIYNKTENKVIGWCITKRFLFSNKNFTENIF